MKTLSQSRKFKKDIKRCAKRGYDLDKLYAVVELLAQGKTLPAANRPHKLSGNFSGWWECHIAPDWLLVYRFDDACVELATTGTHADLFE